MDNNIAPACNVRYSRTLPQEPDNFSITEIGSVEVQGNVSERDPTHYGDPRNCAQPEYFPTGHILYYATI